MVKYIEVNKTRLGRKMLYKQILKLVEKISPQARNYVDEMYKRDNVEILCSIETDNNKGVFLVAENNDCCILFASFIKENNMDDILEIIRRKTKEYSDKANEKELCFNVYGENNKIIQLVRSMGFKSDMQGYHLEYMADELPQLIDNDLTYKKYDISMLKQYVELFDSAYYQINSDNNWDVAGHAKNKEQFNKRLIALNESDQVHSFWLRNELAGVYIYQDNYITDIVVDPAFQNKGYGTFMLSHCIHNMSIYKQIKNIKLRVVKSNTAAKRLYQRNGFVEIAHFAEHTLSQ